MDNYRDLSESRMSAGGAEKLLHLERSEANMSSWSCDVEGHGDIANLQTNRFHNYTKVATPCLDDHHFKEEELKSVGELSKICAQIVLK